MNSIPYEHEGGPKAVWAKLTVLETKLREEINTKRRELSACQRKRNAAYAAHLKLQDKK